MPSSTADSLTALRQTILTTQTILAHLDTLPATLPYSPTSPNALALLSTATTLLRANTTKLSLLVLNKPFTPTAITTILKSLCGECIPALASAAQLCGKEMYTTTVQAEVRSGVTALFRELRALLGEIPVDERGFKMTGGRDTLGGTGVIWDRCDELIALSKKGVRGAVSGKIEEYKELLVDASNELELWLLGAGKEEDLIAGLRLEEPREETKDSTESEEEEDEDDDFGIQRAPGPAIRPLATKAHQTFCLLQLLYPPLIKRRVKRFPPIDASTATDAFPPSSQIAKLDALVRYCEMFSEEADEVAGSLYQGEVEDVRTRLETMRTGAKMCCEGMRERWEGGEDEFSVWVGKWLVKLGELS